MEKEQIISTLTGKLGTTQLSSRTIDTYIENNLLGEGGEYNDAYFDKHVKILKSLQGQFSADVASQVNAFKEDWAKNHKVDVPAPTPPAPAEPNPSDKGYDALFKEIESLKAAIKGEQTKNAQDAVRNEVLAKADELKVSNPYLWKKVVSTTAITDGMNSTQLLDAVKNTYEVELKNIIGSGATPYGVGGNPKPAEPNKTVTDFFAKKKASRK